MLSALMRAVFSSDTHLMRLPQRVRLARLEAGVDLLLQEETIRRTVQRDTALTAIR